MKKLLVVVDMQRDFINEALGTREAEAIVPFAVHEILNGGYDKVLATMDTHGENYLETMEGKHLPVVHCVRGTDGWKFPKEIGRALESVQAEIIEKPTFGSYALCERVFRLDPEEIFILGLCTDICVISNALLLKAFMYEKKITVLKDGCAATTPQKQIEALHVLESCQIEIQ